MGSLKPGTSPRKGGRTPPTSGSPRPIVTSGRRVLGLEPPESRVAVRTCGSDEGFCTIRPLQPHRDAAKCEDLPRRRSHPSGAPHVSVHLACGHESAVPRHGRSDSLCAAELRSGVDFGTLRIRRSERLGDGDRVLRRWNRSGVVRGRRLHRGRDCARELDREGGWHAQWSGLGLAPNASLTGLAVFDDGTGPAIYASGQRWNGLSRTAYNDIAKRSADGWVLP
jgi:hypothetical protein